MTKGGVDPFIGTPLLEVLLRNNISRVALAGVATNLVVESAARHAIDSGLSVVVLADLCASFARGTARVRGDQDLAAVRRGQRQRDVPDGRVTGA